VTSGCVKKNLAPVDHPGIGEQLPTGRIRQKAIIAMAAVENTIKATTLGTDFVEC
jgi:hypothetical protein